MKIKMTFLSIFLILGSVANAAVTRVQYVAQDCSTAVNCTVNIAPVQPGDLIVVTSLLHNDNNQSAPTVTDNQSNTYTQIWSQAIGGHYAYTMNYLANVTNAPISITVDLTPGGQSIGVIVVEYSGVVTTSPLDVSTTAVNQGTSYSSGTAATTSSNELLVGGVFSNGGDNVGFTGTNGWTNFSTIPEMQAWNTISMQDQGVTSTGSYANAGTATAGANTVGMAAFKTTGPPAANIPGPATYYIDYVSGNDTNNGTSKSSPWQHAPGMVGFSASYIHLAGDHIIFKGGITWPSAVFPMTISHGGVTGIPDYYGVDTTWYDASVCGSSFCRSVFSDGGTSSNTFISFNANNVTVDNIEMTGLYWSGAPPSGTSNFDYVWFGTATNVVVSNSYMHNWNYGGTAQDDFDVFDSALYSGAPWVSQQYVINCIIDGAPNGMGAGMAWHGGGVLRGTIIRNMPNGFLPTGASAEASGNTIGPMTSSFSGRHENQIEDNGVTGTFSIFNNVLHDGNSVAIFVDGFGSAENMYIYNNLIYNTLNVGPSPINLEARTPSGNVYLYNNTIESSNGNIACINTDVPMAFNYLDAENNHCISEKGSIFGTYTTVINKTNLLESHAQAATAGYSLSNQFEPSQPTSPTVGNGTNLISNAANPGLSSLTSDIIGNSRPSTGGWDIGAYEFSDNTYYIDYSNGSDSNNGTSKNTPWQHAPGMANFTGIYTSKAGDHFIFKGGVTLASACFPLRISKGGFSRNPNYYGVDQTWFTGSSWARPFFDGNYQTASIISIGNDLNWITIDSLELAHIYAQNASGAIIGAYEPQNLLMENLNIHGWRTQYSTSSTTSMTIGTGTQTFTIGTGLYIYSGNSIPITVTHDANDTLTGTITSYGSTTGQIVMNITSTRGSGTFNSWTMQTGDNSYGGIIFTYSSGDMASWSNVVLTNSTITNIDNSGNGTQSGLATRQVQTIENSNIHDVSSAVLFTANFIHNTLYNVSYPVTNEGYDESGDYHFNGLYLDQGGTQSGVSMIYDNLIYNAAGGANMIYPNPHGGQTDYIFNNVIYGTQSAQLPIEIDTYNYWCATCGPNGGPNFAEPLPTAAGNVYVYNNTIVADEIDNPNSTAIHVVSTGPNTVRPPLNILVVQNNQIIGAGVYLTDGVQGSNVNSLTSSNNLIQNPTTASAQGYTLVDIYAPSNSSGSTVGQGLNLSSLALSGLNADILGIVRSLTGAWDIGAYEYNGTVSSGPSSAVYGDVDGNGSVTIADAEMAAQAAVGLITLTPTQQQAAMVSSSTETSPTTYDAYLIAEYAVGLITKFPVQGG